MRTGERKKEIEMLNRFSTLRPDEPMVEQNLGVAYACIGMYDTSKSHYLKAIQLMDGRYPLAFCNLGLLYIDMGRLTDAQKMYEEANAQEAPAQPLEALRGHIERLKQGETEKSIR